MSNAFLLCLWVATCSARRFAVEKAVEEDVSALPDADEKARILNTQESLNMQKSVDVDYAKKFEYIPGLANTGVKKLVTPKQLVKMGKLVKVGKMAKVMPSAVGMVAESLVNIGMGTFKTIFMSSASQLAMISDKNYLHNVTIFRSDVTWDETLNYRSIDEMKPSPEEWIKSHNPFKDLLSFQTVAGKPLPPSPFPGSSTSWADLMAVVGVEEPFNCLLLQGKNMGILDTGLHVLGSWHDGATSTMLGTMWIFGVDSVTTDLIKRAQKPVSYQHVLNLLLGRGLAPVYQVAGEFSTKNVGTSIGVAMIVGREIIKAPFAGGCPQITDRRQCCMHTDGRTGDYYHGYDCVAAKTTGPFSSGAICEPSVWVEANDPKGAAAATCIDFGPGRELALLGPAFSYNNPSDRRTLYMDHENYARVARSWNINEDPALRKWSMSVDGIISTHNGKQLYVTSEGFAKVAFEGQEGNIKAADRTWSIERNFAKLGCRSITWAENRDGAAGMQPTSGAQYIKSETNAACPSGSSLINDQAECFKAYDTLKTSESWSDGEKLAGIWGHVMQCGVHLGTDGTNGNTQVHFKADHVDGSSPAEQWVHICKQDSAGFTWTECRNLAVKSGSTWFGMDSAEKYTTPGRANCAYGLPWPTVTSNRSVDLGPNFIPSFEPGCSGVLQDSSHDLNLIVPETDSAGHVLGTGSPPHHPEAKLSAIYTSIGDIPKDFTTGSVLTLANGAWKGYQLYEPTGKNAGYVALTREGEDTNKETYQRTWFITPVDGASPFVLDGFGFPMDG